MTQLKHPHDIIHAYIIASPTPTLHTWRVAQAWTLQRWVARCRQRKNAIRLDKQRNVWYVENKDPTKPTEQSHIDYWCCVRYSYALTLAQMGQHPRWWSYIIGDVDTPPDHDDMPRHKTNHDEYPCLLCGQVATRILERGETWCDYHYPRSDDEQDTHERAMKKLARKLEKQAKARENT